MSFTDPNPHLTQAPDLDWEDLELELLQYEDLELDCDGVTDMIALHLQDKGLEFRYMSGSVEEGRTGRLVSPHCWIEIEGRIIDLRLRRWLGDRDTVPHGIFKSIDTNYRYSGFQCDHQPVNWLAIGEYLDHPEPTTQVYNTGIAPHAWPVTDEELEHAVFANAEAETAR